MATYGDLFRLANGTQKTWSRPRPMPPSVEEWNAQESMRTRQREVGEHEAQHVIIKVAVGQGKAAEDFFVQQDRLTKHSEFAAGAFRSGWIERKENTLRLCEEQPELFKFFHKFVNTGKVPSVRSNLDSDADDSDDSDVEAEEYDRLVDLWLLGDRLMSTSFRDAIMDRLTALLDTNDLTQERLHEKIYPLTARPCAPRRLAVDHALSEWPQGWLEGAEMDESWNEFFKDLAVRVLRGDRDYGKYSFGRPRCVYHEHGEEEMCDRRMSWTA